MNKTSIILVVALLLVILAVTSSNLLATLTAPQETKPCPVAIMNNTTTAPVITSTAPRSAFSILFIDQNGCEYCAMQAPAIANISKQYNVTTINLTTYPNGAAFVKQWNITQTPTIFIYKNNVEIKRFDGVTSEATIRSFLT